jgi:hypothetical protein
VMGSTMKLIAEIPSVSVPNFLFGVVVVPIMALTMYDTDRGIGLPEWMTNLVHLGPNVFWGP